MEYTCEAAIRDVKWSMHHFNLFTIILDNAVALLFNLLKSKCSPSCRQLLSDISNSKDNQTAVFEECLSFSPQNPNLLLVCSNGKDVMTYKIPNVLKVGKESLNSKKKPLGSSNTKLSSEKVDEESFVHKQNIEVQKLQKIFGDF